MPLQHKGDVSAFTDRLVGVIQLVAEIEVKVLERLTDDLKAVFITIERCSINNNRLRRDLSIDDRDSRPSRGGASDVAADPETILILQDLGSATAAAVTCEKALRLLAQVKGEEISYIGKHNAAEVGIVEAYRHSKVIEESFHTLIQKMRFAESTCERIVNVMGHYALTTTIAYWSSLVEEETAALVNGPAQKLYTMLKSKDPSRDGSSDDIFSVANDLFESKVRRFKYPPRHFLP
jgi:hypothetical protein